MKTLLVRMFEMEAEDLPDGTRCLRITDLSEKKKGEPPCYVSGRTAAEIGEVLALEGFLVALEDPVSYHPHYRYLAIPKVPTGALPVSALSRAVDDHAPKMTPFMVPDGMIGPDQC